MSCGDPHDTDCRQVLSELWIFLDNECDHARRELLQRHLDECGPCLEEFGLDKHLKALLARKCGGDHAPDALKQRLRQSIREIMIRQAVLSAEATAQQEDDGTIVEVSTSVESHAWLSTER
ncbi:MAG: mycothiol system anti-sigma-R factor [Actinomycetota bacterium]|nr:mycothiol system anti-sigma-R factor [Actinomycetota bacterium]